MVTKWNRIIKLSVLLTLFHICRWHPDGCIQHLPTLAHRPPIPSSYSWTCRCLWGARQPSLCRVQSLTPSPTISKSPQWRSQYHRSSSGIADYLKSVNKRSSDCYTIMAAQWAGLSTKSSIKHSVYFQYHDLIHNVSFSKEKLSLYIEIFL